MEKHTDETCGGGPLAAAPPALAATLGVIGGKWKLLILWHLHGRASRFSELRRAMPQVTQHMLTAQLRELEADGIISRTVYAEVPPRVVYAITEHGHSLRDVLSVLYEWGAAHLARSGAGDMAAAPSRLAEDGPQAAP